MMKGDTVYEKFGNNKVKIVSFKRRNRTFEVEFLENSNHNRVGERMTFHIDELSKVPGEPARKAEREGERRAEQRAEDYYGGFGD